MDHIALLSPSFTCFIRPLFAGRSSWSLPLGLVGFLPWLFHHHEASIWYYKVPCTYSYVSFFYWRGPWALYEACMCCWMRFLRQQQCKNKYDKCTPFSFQIHFPQWPFVSFLVSVHHPPAQSCKPSVLTSRFLLAWCTTGRRIKNFYKVICTSCFLHAAEFMFILSKWCAFSTSSPSSSAQFVSPKLLSQ